MEVYTVSQPSNPVWVPQTHFKEHERNLLAAMFGIVVIAVLATAIAHPRWFSLKGGGCSQVYLGVQNFFPKGHFEYHTRPYLNNLHMEISRKGVYPTSLIYVVSDHIEMRDCVTPEIVCLQRINIALCILALLCSLIQFTCDTFGPLNHRVRMLRRNALGSILTVVLCIASVGVCFCSSRLMEEQQEASKKNPGTKVDVKFDISFYLVTSAGAVAILTAAANLLKHYPLMESGDRAEDHLLDDYEGGETFSVGDTRCQLWPCRSTANRSNPSVREPSLQNSEPATNLRFPSVPPPPYAP